MARKVAAALGGHVRGKTVAVLGRTFKPNTDDMRDAPSIPLIIVPEWEQFRALDLGLLKGMIRQAVLVGLRNVYRHDEVASLGFAYDSIGQLL
jgi:UDPglucose 6-dehydrogenase